MAWMGVADGGYVAGMARSREPVPDGSPDRASPAVLIASWLSRDQEKQASLLGDCLLELQIQTGISKSQVMAVKIEDEIRLNLTTRKPAVPGRIEMDSGTCPSGLRLGRGSSGGRRRACGTWR
jgi:hypothetical protein